MRSSNTPVYGAVRTRIDDLRVRMRGPGDRAVILKEVTSLREHENLSAQEAFEVDWIEATFLFRMGRFRESQKVLERHAESQPEGLTHELLGNYFNIFAVNLRRFGRLEEAMFYFEKGLKHHEMSGNARGQAMVYINMANVAFGQGKFGKVLDYRSRATLHIDPRKDADWYALVLINSAWDHLLMGEYGYIEEYLVRIEKMLEQGLSPREELYFHILNAEVQIRREAGDKAQNLLQRATQIAAEVNDLNMTSLVKRAQGLLACHMGRFSEAREILAIAEAGYEESGYKDAALRARIEIAIAFLREGDLASAGAILASFSLADCPSAVQATLLEALILKARLAGDYEAAFELIEARDLRRRDFQIERCRFHFDWMDFQLQLKETQHQIQLMERDRRAVSEKNELLERANMNLIQTNESREQIISMLSHDLRSPLASIISSLECVELDIALGERELLPQLLPDLKRHTERALESLEHILDLQRLDNGNMRPRMESVSLTKLLEESLKDFWKHASAKSIRLETDIMDTLPEVRTDAILFQHALGNLISNAIKFSPGGKSVSIGVSIDNEAGMALINVKDEGPGVPECLVNQLFMQFQNLGAVPTGGESSHGLGLHITRRIADLLGGKTGYSPNPSGGAVFKLWIPLAGSQGGGEAGPSPDVETSER